MGFYRRATGFDIWIFCAWNLNVVDETFLFLITQKPSVGNPHAGFEERGEETWSRWRQRHRHQGARHRQRLLLPPSTSAPLFDSTDYVPGNMIRNQRLRAAPEILQRTHVRSEPALRILPPNSPRRDSTNSPQHRHEHRQRLPRVVDKRLLARLVLLQHHRQLPRLPLRRDSRD